MKTARYRGSFPKRSGLDASGQALINPRGTDGTYVQATHRMTATPDELTPRTTKLRGALLPATTGAAPAKIMGTRSRHPHVKALPWCRQGVSKHANDAAQPVPTRALTIGFGPTRRSTAHRRCARYRFKSAVICT
jgi:hypothetical protein